jgi:hypothetical protein
MIDHRKFILIDGPESEAARGDVPLFSFTDVAAFAAKHHQSDRTAAFEALSYGILK